MSYLNLNILRVVYRPSALNKLWIIIYFLDRIATEFITVSSDTLHIMGIDWKYKCYNNYNNSSINFPKSWQYRLLTIGLTKIGLAWLVVLRIRQRKCVYDDVPVVRSFSLRFMLTSGAVWLISLISFGTMENFVIDERNEMKYQVQSKLVVVNWYRPLSLANKHKTATNKIRSYLY